jgi:hypothetical protein
MDWPSHAVTMRLLDGRQVHSEIRDDAPEGDGSRITRIASAGKARPTRRSGQKGDRGRAASLHSPLTRSKSLSASSANLMRMIWSSHRCSGSSNLHARRTHLHQRKDPSLSRRRERRSAAKDSGRSASNAICPALAARRGVEGNWPAYRSPAKEADMAIASPIGPREGFMTKLNPNALALVALLVFGGTASAQQGVVRATAGRLCVTQLPQTQVAIRP